MALLAVMAGATALAACSAEPGTQSTTPALSTATGSADGTSTTATGTSAPSAGTAARTAIGATSPTSSTLASLDDVDVIVTASGGGGLIMSLAVADLTVTGKPAVASTWLTFDLVLGNCCGEPNRVVFPATGGGFDTDIGDTPALRLTGPTCTPPVSCTADARTLALTAPGPAAVRFELASLVAPADLVAAGTFRTTLTPAFDFAHESLDDEPLAIEIRIDVQAARAMPTGDTTPAATPTMPAASVGGGFDLLAFPAVAVADDAAQLSAALAASPRTIDIDALGIGWSTHAAIVLAIPTDACPPLFNGLRFAGRTVEAQFVDAGYTACVQPLLSHTVIAAVERGVLADVDGVELPAMNPYFDAPVSAPVDIKPAPTQTPTVEPPAQPEFGDMHGTADLPARGEVVTARLTDGTPVYVVRHHDDTVSALDPRGDGAYTGNDTDGQHQLVAWTPSTRLFLGGGAWDEYGRRVDGPRASDLVGYATRVAGHTVEIGSPVPAPTGSPIAATADIPAMAAPAMTLGEPISLDQALAQPAGTTAFIDARVVVDPDGAHVCVVDIPGANVQPCPAGAPPVDDVAAQGNARTAWFGPLLATRTATGFTRVAPTGGYAGGAL